MAAVHFACIGENGGMEVRNAKQSQKTKQM
jgi:hypothetical protein